MRLQERIKKDLTAAIKARDEETKETLRVVIGEFGRLEGKEVSDDDVVKVLGKLIKSEKELLAQKGAAGSPFITVIEAYLPRMADDDEIRAWIAANVDFTAFKNKMQAMGTIMQHFGSRADGNRVKAILQQL